MLLCSCLLVLENQTKQTKRSSFQSINALVVPPLFLFLLFSPVPFLMYFCVSREKPCDTHNMPFWIVLSVVCRDSWLVQPFMNTARERETHTHTRTHAHVHHRPFACHAVDRHGSTALHWAAGGGHMHVCRWLLEEAQADALHTQPASGRNALHWAARNGHAEVCVCVCVFRSEEM